MRNTVQQEKTQCPSQGDCASPSAAEQPPKGMNILLLGGSNAGLRDGWATQLQMRAGAHVVENRFLGAVGSLYGLMALLKHLREGAALPDLVVFEYCLNDVLLVDAGVLREPLIFDTLDAIVNLCADARLPLLFLCLEPRPDGPRESRKALARVQPLYMAAARRAGAPCLWLNEIFNDELTKADYQDENHLTPAASARVAEALLASIGAGASTPRRISVESPRFDYVDATQARTQGPCHLRPLTTRVFAGPFLDIARGGASFWTGDGRLVGLMLQSTETSGVYLIRAQSGTYRKNPCSRMQEIVRNLVLLHYTSRVISVHGEVEISMPDNEARLMSFAEDRTLLAVPPAAPFAAQRLEIHGVMFWRPRSMLHRLRAYFSR